MILLYGDTMNGKTHSLLKKAAIWLLSALVILLTTKYIIPIFWPFILAFFISLILDPLINKLRKKFCMKRGFASAFIVALFLALFLGVASFIIMRLCSTLGSHIQHMPETLSRISIPSTDLPQRLERIASTLPAELNIIFRNMLDSLREQTATLPSRLYTRFFDFISNAASKAPNILFSVLMFALGLFFISAGLPVIRSFILRQLPAKLRTKAGTLKSDVLSTLKGWGKAQLKLMGLCFIELSAAFLLMRIQNAVLLAAGIAVIDALPVFGIGLALIPWGVFSLLIGNYRRAILIALTYALINLVRSCLEPRLLGEQTGLHPAATLITVYAGYSISGVSGMILFPIALMLLKQFNDRGWIKLWR